MHVGHGVEAGGDLGVRRPEHILADRQRALVVRQRLLVVALDPHDHRLVVQQAGPEQPALLREPVNEHLGREGPLQPLPRASAPDPDDLHQVHRRDGRQLVEPDRSGVEEGAAKRGLGAVGVIELDLQHTEQGPCLGVERAIPERLDLRQQALTLREALLVAARDPQAVHAHQVESQRLDPQALVRGHRQRRASFEAVILHTRRERDQARRRGDQARDVRRGAVHEHRDRAGEALAALLQAFHGQRVDLR